MSVVERHILSADTQAILLLCGRYNHQEQVEPLKQSEYNRLVEWLVAHEMRPADLLDEGWIDRPRSSSFPLEINRVSALLRRGAALAFAVENWTSKGLWVLSRSDDAYPRLFRTRLGRLAPPILYGAGPLALLARGGLAIVGSRDADDEALTLTREVASACARQGVQVVSGGARGVDSEAMGAALDASGTVIGFLADSLARQAVSSRYRRALADEHLVLLSATAPDSGFNAGNAMARNKCIYALATWGLVVSATFGEGGTWAGAVEELDAKRIPLFVRAGQPLSPAQRKLIELGARPFPSGPWHGLTGMLDEAASTSPRQVALPVEAATPPQPMAVPGECTTRQSEESPPVSPSADVSESQRSKPTSLGSVYDAVLPLLLAHLAEPRDIESIAASLEVQKGQLQRWLAKATADGVVKKLQHPVRYVTVCQPKLPLDMRA